MTEFAGYLKMMIQNLYKKKEQVIASVLLIFLHQVVLIVVVASFVGRIIIRTSCKFPCFLVYLIVDLAFLEILF